jgi:hypothetical protein
MVPEEGIEPPTFGLQNRCSTAELIRHAAVSYQAAGSRTSRANGPDTYNPAKPNTMAITQSAIAMIDVHIAKVR